MNAIGLVLTALPDSYAHQMNERIVEVIKGLANHPASGTQTYAFMILYSLQTKVLEYATICNCTALE